MLCLKSRFCAGITRINFRGNMRYVLGVLIAMMLSACGTATSVKLDIAVPDKTSFAFQDERPSDQKQSQVEDSPVGETEVYGDDSLSPPVTEMLCATLQKHLGRQLDGKTITLTKFYVRVFEPSTSVDYNRLHASAASIPGGYAAEPLAGLLISGINKIKSEKVVSIDVEGKVGDTPFQNSLSDIYRGRVTESNIRTSLEHSLQQVVMEIKQIEAEESEVGNAGAQVVPAVQQSGPEESGVGDCNGHTPGISAEAYFNQGETLVAANNYQAAMACFLRAQEREKGTYIYQESCMQIATMYELGLGVDKNADTARAWVKKSGL
jgi:hypothetical protein